MVHRHEASGRKRAAADMQMVARGDHIGADDPSLPFDNQFCCDAQSSIPATMW
jgi:hypothetical protein